MAGERQLEPTAERGAVDRGHHRLRRGFDRGDHLVQAGRLHGLAELADVGAGGERATRPGEHHGLYGRIFDLLERIDQPGAHRVLERVDRWILDGDDCDVVVALEIDAGVHAAHGFLPTGIS